MKNIKQWAMGAVLLLAAMGAVACPSLSSLMDQQYGLGAWSHRDAPGGGTDIAPAIYAGVLAGGQVCVDRGQWALKTPLDPTKISGSSIRGVSSQSSVIFYQHDGAPAFWFSGSEGRTGGGLHSIAIVLDVPVNKTGATAIMLKGDSFFQPDQMSFSDIYITAVGNAYWYAGFYAFGNDRASPKGIRVVDARNVQIFRVHAIGVWLSNIVQWSITNIGIYVGLGAGQNLYIAGGGNASTNSELVSVNSAAISGQINLTNTSRFDISGSCASLATMANATQGRVFLMSCPVIGVFGAGVHVSP